MPPQHQQQKTDAQAWASSCDPLTIVSVAREGLYDPGKRSNPDVEAATAEIISRFEMQQRASLGTSAFLEVQP